MDKISRSVKGGEGGVGLLVRDEEGASGAGSRLKVHSAGEVGQSLKVLSPLAERRFRPSGERSKV